MARPVTSGPAELSADRELLSEVIHASLLTLVEIVDDHLDGYLTGRVDVSDIREAVDRLLELLEVFAVTELAVAIA